MNWLIAKQILQKVWFYIKNYWWVGALIALGFVLHKFFLFDKDVLGGLYEEKAKQNEKELKVINETHKHERVEKERATEDFKVAVEALEEERKQAGEKVKKEEKKRIKEIVAMPEEERVSALADEFGLEIVEVEE
jgi:uncharacterized membrane protein|tara:strand:- start:629 stop:1033 length:405 start_codon:yes stop_codon:yes gene_type:complete